MSSSSHCTGSRCIKLSNLEFISSTGDMTVLVSSLWEFLKAQYVIRLQLFTPLTWRVWGFTPLAPS